MERAARERRWTSGAGGCRQHPHGHLLLSTLVDKLSSWGVVYKKPEIIGTLGNWEGESWRGFDGLGPRNSKRSAGFLMRPVTQVQQGDLAASLKCSVTPRDTGKSGHLESTGRVRL